MIHSKGHKAKLKNKKPGRVDLSGLSGLSWAELRSVAKAAGVNSFGLSRVALEKALS